MILSRQEAIVWELAACPGIGERVSTLSELLACEDADIERLYEQCLLKIRAEFHRDEDEPRMALVKRDVWTCPECGTESHVPSVNRDLVGRIACPICDTIMDEAKEDEA